MNFFVLRMVLAVAVSAVFSLTANAQAPYPNQGIRFIVPYAPGGLPDTVARIVGQHLQERIGQSVVIENRASGGAVLAVAALMGAPADGYTFLVTDGGILSTNPALFKQLSYNPKDIIPLALLGRAPMFLATHPDLPVSTLREFIDYVKARPGEINYGSSGVGSIHHLSMEALKAPLQLKMTHIPYRGTGQSVPALLGGHVQVLFAAYPSLAGAAESKKVKLLAQNGEGRWFQAPDVPAVSEVVSNFDLATIVGLFARPGVPQITAEAIAAANSPAAEKQLRAAGIMHPSSSARSCQRQSRSRRQGLALTYGHAMRGAGFENRRDIHLVAGPPQQLAAGHNARVLVLGLLARSDRSDASVSTISSSWAKRTYAKS